MRRSGFHSCGAWVAWRCGMDPRSAREHVRVARALEDLPLLHEEFSCGKLSYSKVRAITRIATPEIEAELVEMARYATAAQLDRLVRGYRRAVSLESAEAAHRDRFLSCEWDEDGSLRVRGRLAPEDGALFLQAIEHGRGLIREREEEDRAASQGGSAGPEPPIRVNDADALMEVAERSLGAASDPRPAGERHQVVVHAEAGARGGPEEPGGAIEDGPAISPRARGGWPAMPARLGGAQVAGGAAAMRRALDARDEGRCRFPGSARGGVRAGRGRGGGLVFRRPDGRRCRLCPPLLRARRGSCAGAIAEARLPIGPGSLVSLGRGERYGPGLAVAGLLARAGPVD